MTSKFIRSNCVLGKQVTVYQDCQEEKVLYSLHSSLDLPGYSGP
jgi:hypothetical protein